jgi:hypothetical protein
VRLVGEFPHDMVGIHRVGIFSRGWLTSIEGDFASKRRRFVLVSCISGLSKAFGFVFLFLDSLQLRSPIGKPDPCP